VAFGERSGSAEGLCEVVMSLTVILHLLVGSQDGELDLLVVVACQLVVGDLSVLFHTERSALS